MRLHKFKLLSFSGIDGSGKSTQIEVLLRRLESHEYRFRLYSFWDDAVAFSKYRERLSLRIFKGERGVGRPDRPITRRDKNVTSWNVVLLRFLLYILDALRLVVVVFRSAAQGVEVVIFDRYIYDELANLPLQHWPVRMYARLLSRVVPKPDVAFLLDADPEVAVFRKPEYPLEFVRRNRNAYLSIANIVGMTVLPPSSILHTAQIIRAFLADLAPDAMEKLITSDPLPASSAKTPSG